MKKILPLFISVIASAGVLAQSKKYFAVTGETAGSTNWFVFKQFNTADNSVSKTLYVPSETNEVVYDALTAKPLLNPNNHNAPAQSCSCLNSRMVAAIAYDAADNRLYYTPMTSNQLRYLDLNSSQPKSYAVTLQLLKNFNDLPGEASIITRMCFAANGFGYALTNDNTHLVQFSTKKQSDIKDLGALIDDKSNGVNSIKTQLKSWGGDMIADASGSLYLFTMQRGIFKINPATNIATYIGDIKNIPGEYTINAAMAEGNENVIVASSISTASYYRVNLNTLEATSVFNGKQVLNVSDFANENFAFGNKSESTISAKKFINASAVSIYPNPVINHNFSLEFKNFESGKYSVQLSEAGGKAVMQKDILINGYQTEKFITPSNIAAGVYIVKVVNKNAEEVFSSKVIIAN